MVSVTDRVKHVKQPDGGYINPDMFEVTCLDDDLVLNPNENIDSSLIGMAVDYLTRYMSNKKEIKDAFKISLKGASIVNQTDHAMTLLSKITGLDDESIINACMLVGYDDCYRGGPQEYKSVEDIKPDQPTISNIRTMVNRSLNFIKEYGPITKYGFRFMGASAKYIQSGDGDFLTQDTVWDFKVSKHEPTEKHTLQLLIYYLMGRESFESGISFLFINSLGIFNPRLNKVYILDVCDIPEEVIEKVSSEVIGLQQSNDW